jgi:hypothetical protein
MPAVDGDVGCEAVDPHSVGSDKLIADDNRLKWVQPLAIATGLIRYIYRPYTALLKSAKLLIILPILEKAV